MSIINHIILVLLWIVFGVLHSVLAATWWKRKMQLWLKNYYKYYPFGYSVFAALTLILILVYQFSMQSRLLFALPLWAKVVIALPGFGGLIIMLSQIKKYFYSLSGISVFFKKQPPEVLELGGLNRYVRHPLYAGTLLFMWSLILLFPFLNHVLAGIVITLYTLAGAKLEEKKLVAQFGEQYIKYRKQVPMIIPRASIK